VNEWTRREELMVKLAIIGIVVAGLVAPATAAGTHRAKIARAQAARACLQVRPIFPPGKNATVCGLTVWVRDPATGAVIPVAMGKWRTEVPPYGP
jgi:hypothetical protein